MFWTVQGSLDKAGGRRWRLVLSKRWHLLPPFFYLKNTGKAAAYEPRRGICSAKRFSNTTRFSRWSGCANRNSSAISNIRYQSINNFGKWQIEKWRLTLTLHLLSITEKICGSITRNDTQKSNFFFAPYHGVPLTKIFPQGLKSEFTFAPDGVFEHGGRGGGGEESNGYRYLVTAL
jgi:hypothetical protein